MGKLIIDGGKTVSGEICVQGAKNAVLPILAATVMADGESVIKNCPRLRDVDKTTLVSDPALRQAAPAWHRQNKTETAPQAP